MGIEDFPAVEQGKKHEWEPGASPSDLFLCDNQSFLPKYLTRFIAEANGSAILFINFSVAF